jgi:hypothetical protein
MNILLKNSTHMEHYNFATMAELYITQKAALDGPYLHNKPSFGKEKATREDIRWTVIDQNHTVALPLSSSSHDIANIWDVPTAPNPS